MDKKTTKKPAAKKDEGEEKTKKAPAKKAASKKADSKKGAKPDVEGVSHEAAEVRAKQEENSIAPPSSNLVSAFAMFKKRNVSTVSPTITRLAADATAGDRASDRLPTPEQSAATLARIYS